MSLLNRLSNNRARNRSEPQGDDFHTSHPIRSSFDNRSADSHSATSQSFRTRAVSLFGKSSEDKRDEDRRSLLVPDLSDEKTFLSTNSTDLSLSSRRAVSRTDTAEMGAGELNLEHLDHAGYGEGLGLAPELIVAPGTPSGSELDLRLVPTQSPSSGLQPELRKTPSRTSFNANNKPPLPNKFSRVDSALSIDTNALSHDSHISADSGDGFTAPLQRRKLTTATQASGRPRSNTGPKGRNRGPSIAGAIAMPGVQMALSNVTTQSPPFSAKAGSGRSEYNGSEGDYQEFMDNALGGMLSLDALNDLDDVMGALGPGYAFASAKRNAEFHNLFKSVTENDSLIEDYGCALQREILLQGRLYISEQHLCFHANIFGWVTNLVIPFAEVITIEKRMTAFVIPNAIQISTLNSRNTFASFLSRDATYDLICDIWKVTHPGVPFSAALPDTVVETQGVDSDPESYVDAEDEAKKKKKKKGRRSKSKTGGNTPINQSSDQMLLQADASSKTIPLSLGSIPSPRKAINPPTQCKCLKSGDHYKEVALDATFPSSPEKIYNLMFTSTFMKGFWADNQKLQDLEISDWAPEKTGSHLLARSMSYVKPLNAPVGPKSTKCHIKDETLHVDFEDYISILTVTRTPDVPSGKSFSVETKTCMMWARNQGCRVIVTTAVKWTGSSFIKGIIEKSAIDGQKTFHSELEKEMRAYIAQHVTEFKVEGADSDDVPTGMDETFDETLQVNSISGIETANTTISQSQVKTSVVSTAMDFISDLISGFGDMSLGTLIVGGIIFVLVLSNIWTMSSLRRVTKAMKSSIKSQSNQLSSSDFTRDLTDWLRTHDLVPVSNIKNIKEHICPVSTDARTEIEELLRLLADIENRSKLIKDNLYQQLASFHDMPQSLQS